MHEKVFRIQVPESVYDAHQQVWALMGGRAQRDFIFRVRTNGAVALAKVRSLSEIEGGVPMSRVEPNGLHRFSVLTTPVTRSRFGEKPLRRSDEVSQWLSERLSAQGVKLISAAHQFLPSPKFGKPRHRHYIHTVESFGVLQIEDAHKANLMLAHGIGRLRGMGYGMVELEGM